MVRGSLTREGDDLEVHTHSVERLDRILEALEGEVEIIERTVTPPDQMEVDESSDIPELVLSSAQRAEIIAHMEDRWLGESVPALGGLTPREAAADPTRREDLLALLRQFDQMPVPEGALTYNPDSLRRKLGIDG